MEPLVPRERAARIEALLGRLGGSCLLLIAQGGEDLLVFGEATRVVLGEDLFAVDDDVEDSLASTNQFRFDAEVLRYGGRQTGGLG